LATLFFVRVSRSDRCGQRLDAVRQVRVWRSRLHMMEDLNRMGIIVSIISANTN
jgi:hypothetical protein